MTDYLLIRGHSLLHCWSADQGWTLAGLCAFLAISAAYMGVAAVSFLAANKCKHDGLRRAYRTHVAVFTLCMGCGYGFEILAAFDLNFYRVRVLFLWVLAAASAAHLYQIWSLAARGLFLQTNEG